MVANVKYINDSTIYWKSIDENDSIDEQTKAMKMRKIDNGKFFISWIGDYGVTSSQVVDLNSRSLKTIFQHKACTVKLYADSFYKVQKNSHSSFEVICCCS